MRFGDLLLRLLPGRIRSPTPDDLRKVMRKIVGRCPVCGLDLEGHADAELSRVIAGGPTESQADAAAANNDWSALVSFREWNVETDILEYRAIRCSRREELGLVRILFRAGLGATEELQDSQQLSLEESRRIANMIADRWRPL
jgi:hypothetical protein